MLSPVERLVAIEEIKNLKARYFRFVDSHDWAGFRSLLMDDAVFALPKMPDPKSEASFANLVEGADIVGAEAIVAWVSKSLEPSQSAHLGYMPEIEILSATQARGVWGMEDIVRWPGRTIHGYGYYRETYVRHDGDWRIKTWALFYKSMEICGLGVTSTRIV